MGVCAGFEDSFLAGMYLVAAGNCVRGLKIEMSVEGCVGALRPMVLPVSTALRTDGDFSNIPSGSVAAPRVI